MQQTNKFSHPFNGAGKYVIFCSHKIYIYFAYALMQLIYVVPRLLYFRPTGHIQFSFGFTGENLRVVATASVGYDNLDVKTLKAKGIRIGYLNSPAEMTVTVAEHAIGLLFATARCIANDHLALRK